MSMRYGKFVIALAAMAAVLGTVGGSAPATAATKLLFGNFIPHKHPMFRGVFRPWVDRVARETQGRVTIEFSGKSLAPVPRQLGMVRKGVADIGFTGQQWIKRTHVLPHMGELPTVSEDERAAVNSVALWRTYEKFFAPANEYADVKLVGLWSFQAFHIFNNKRPIKTVGDWANLKLRCNPGTEVNIVSAAGGVVISKPISQVYQMVARGIVDGTLLAPDVLFVYKVHNKLRYGTRVPGGLWRPVGNILMNKAKWNGLARADREAVDRASGEAVARSAGFFHNSYNAAWGKLEKAGMQDTVAAPSMLAEIRARTADTYDKWIRQAKAKGVDGAAALAYFRNQVAELGKTP